MRYYRLSVSIPMSEQPGDTIAALVAGVDHNATVLGPFAAWPAALRTAFRSMAASQFPMFIGWGDDILYLYNTACIPIVGARHSRAFGLPFRELWPEVWDDLAPLLRAALEGVSSYREKLPVMLDRGGVPSPAWFTFSYSPLFDDSGNICGILSVALDETANVVAAKRDALRASIDTQLRTLTQPDAMTTSVAGLLNDFFGAGGCSIRLLDGAALDDFSEVVILSAAQRAGLVTGQAAGCTGASASLTVPLMRRGQLAGLVQMSSADARHWTLDDVAVLREAGDRLRSALQRVAAETAARRGEEELRRLADALPVLISYVDAEERYRFANRAYEAWFGKPGELLIGQPVIAAVGEAAYQQLKPALDKALAGEAGVMERVIPYRDGGERFVQITYVPRRDGTGGVQGYYALVQDIGDQKRAEAALRQSERRLSEVLESVSDGFFAVDASWRFSVFNRACELAFATERQSVIGKVIWDVFPATRQPDFATRLRAVAENHAPDCFEADSIVTPGALVEIRAAPKDGGGVAVAFSDITQRKRAEEHRQLLVNELNHRVKNTLAVVQAIATQSFKPGSEMETARLAFEGRLATLSGAHTLLTEQNWQSALLADVVEGAVLAAAEPARFAWSGPAVLLMPQTAVSLSLALHELCTNAVKYGALSVPAGKVTIVWDVAPDQDGNLRLHFAWTESGGPPVVPPLTRGFGSRLLENGLARELRGEVRLSFADSGLVCRIDVPLPQPGTQPR